MATLFSSVRETQRIVTHIMYVAICMFTDGLRDIPRGKVTAMTTRMPTLKLDSVLMIPLLFGCLLVATCGSFHIFHVCLV